MNIAIGILLVGIGLLIMFYGGQDEPKKEVSNVYVNSNPVPCVKIEWYEDPEYIRLMKEYYELLGKFNSTSDELAKIQGAITTLLVDYETPPPEKMMKDQDPLLKREQELNKLMKENTIKRNVIVDAYKNQVVTN